MILDHCSPLILMHEERSLVVGEFVSQDVRMLWCHRRSRDTHKNSHRNRVWKGQGLACGWRLQLLKSEKHNSAWCSFGSIFNLMDFLLLNVVHAEGIARVVPRVCVFLVIVCWERESLSWCKFESNIHPLQSCFGIFLWVGSFEVVIVFVI